MRPVQGFVWCCALALLGGGAETARAGWCCAPACPPACCYEPCPPRCGPIRRFLHKCFHPCCPRPVVCPPAPYPAPVGVPFAPAAPVPPPPPLPTASGAPVPPATIERAAPVPPAPEPPPAVPGAGSSYRLPPRLTPPVPPRPVPLDRIASSAEPAPAALAGRERGGP